MDSFRSSLIVALVIAVFAGAPVSAQEATPADGASPLGATPVVFARKASGPYRTLERSDWSRYDNGKYLGHVYREVRATISPSGSASALQYRGDFLVLEETLRDLSQSARAVDEVIPAAFRMAADGRIDMIEDRGFPSIRGFPAFPVQAVAVGQRWTAKGVRAADPRNEGKPILVPLIAEYEYRGIEQYKGIPVHRVFAKYATRYKANGNATPVTGGAAFVAASGTHDADILIRAEDGLPLLIRDRLDETFTWGDGSTTRFKGFTLTFSEGISLMDRSAVVADLHGVLGGKKAAETGSGEKPGSAPSVAATSKPAAGAASATGSPGSQTSADRPAPSSLPVAEAAPPQNEEPSGMDAKPVRAGTEGLAASGDFALAPSAQGIVVEEVDAGVRLTVRDIRFKADSDEILGSERGRLDLISEALKKAGDRTIMVDGHTAAVGKAAGELELSTRRAKRLVDELSARGIAADRFLYKGWGGSRPIASNDTEEGRAKNRRVEITILD